MIPQPRHAGPLNGGEAQPRQGRRGLDELNEQPKQQVGAQKQLEAAAIRQRAAALSQPCNRATCGVTVAIRVL